MLRVGLTPLLNNKKGIVSTIWEDEDMPGGADLIITGESPFNRLNIGQLYEQFITCAASKLIDRLKTTFNESNYLPTYNTILEFINDIRPVYAEYIRTKLTSKEDIADYVDDVLRDGLFLIIPPFTNSLTPKMILKVAKKWGVKREYLTYRRTLPTGEKQTVVTKTKALIGGEKQAYLLGKYPLDQMNCIEFGVTNQFRTPIKPNKLSRGSTLIYGQTPIRYGEDEIALLTLSLGPELTARFIGLYANSPPAINMLQRRLLTDAYPTQLGSVEMSTEEIVATNSNVSLFKHQLGAVGYELKRVNSNIDNPGIQPPPPPIVVSDQAVRSGAPSCLLKLYVPLLATNEKDYSTIRLSFEQYSVPYFVDEAMHQNQIFGRFEFVFQDQVTVKIPKRLGLLNILFWEPLMYFGIQPTVDDLFNIKYFTGKEISNIHSRIYERLITTLPDISHIALLEQIWFNINRLSQFIQLFCAEHLPSMDVLGLSRMMADPRVKHLAEAKSDPKNGTDVAEVQQKSRKRELIELINTPGAVDDNILLPYMRAKTLKENQIPQALLAYGCRSDVDDTMRKWVINESSLSGLKNTRDFATETLSAKKAIYFSRNMVRRSQYWGRKVRLANSLQRYLYPGHCGSTTTIPFIIQEDWKINYLHRAVMDGQCRVYLTKNNIEKYSNTPIRLISPFGCRHTNGICEACAGYGKGRLIKYMPPNAHIGLLAGAMLTSEVSQLILSTKHLTNTSSKLYNLPELAQRYFTRDGESIYWHSQLKKQFKHLSIRIPTDCINPITDLNMEQLPTSETFSRLAYIELLRDDKLVDVIHLEAEMFIPYFSEDALVYIRSIYNQLQADDDNIIIPLHGFDVTKPMLKYIVLNDDMFSYTKRVDGFLQSDLSNYTSVRSAISDFATLVYSKATLNSFYLELVLRSFLVESPDLIRVPIITDPERVSFQTLESVINGSSVSGKLAFERLGAWLQQPSTSLHPKPQGLFSMYFGL